MKKIISLLLVVILCLPASLIIVSADGTYTVAAADGANTSSDNYIDIIKYLDYYDGGDTLNIPDGYITVGQWKENIKNPSINANGLADTDYITDACTLTLVYDDSTEKTVSIKTNEYNYQYKTFDKTAEPDTNGSYKLSSYLQLTSGGSQGTITPSIITNPDNTYAMQVSIANMTESASNRYAQVNQALAGINEDISEPYIISADVALSGGSQTKLDFAFMRGSQQRASKTIAAKGSADMNKLSSGTPVNVRAHVFPKSNRADIYVDGNLVAKNHSLVTSDSEYKDYGNLFIRVYVNEKVDGELKETSLTVSDYSIIRGYGKCDAEIYVPAILTVNNYGDSISEKAGELEPIDVSINKDGYTKVLMYVDGYKTEEVNVVGRNAVLPVDSIGLGSHNVEIKMYSEKDGYVSKTMTVDISDIIMQDSYAEDFETFDAGRAPTDRTLASGVKSAFIRLQNESVEIDEDNPDNKFLHVTADKVIEEGGGSRNEISFTTARDGVYSIRFKFNTFIKPEITFVEVVQNADAANGLSRTLAAIVKLKGDSLKISGNDFATIEAGKWYKFDFEAFLSNNIANYYLYNEDGDLVASQSTPGVSGIKVANTFRTYVPCLTPTDDRSAEMFLDDITYTTVKYTGSITGITAKAENPYTVLANMNNISTVDKVEIENSIGDVAVMYNELDAAAGLLNITLNQPLVVGMRYNIRVYADGLLYPITSSFKASGEYVAVNEYVFSKSGGADNVVLNIENTYKTNKDIKVIVSTYDGGAIESVRAVNVTVQPGAKDYSVKITEDVSRVKILPIMSYAKPTAIYAGGIITK